MYQKLLMSLTSEWDLFHHVQTQFSVTISRAKTPACDVIIFTIFCFSIKQTEPLPHHTFEIDAEPEDKDEVAVIIALNHQKYSVIHSSCVDRKPTLSSY